MAPEKLTADAFKNNLQFITERKPYRFQGQLIPEWFGQASVLVLFWMEDKTIKVVMTERSSNLADHKGEVCFPGGRVEKNETHVNAALREAEEEIGIDKERIRVIGRLSDAWSGSAFHLVPFVGWHQGKPELKRNPDEVEKIIIFDLNELIYKCNHYKKHVVKNGVTFLNDFIESSQDTVFGLSADILLEAIEIGLQKRSNRGIDRGTSLQHALDNGFFNHKLDK